MDDSRLEGWAVARRGATPDQVDAEFTHLRDQVRQNWQSVFPPRRGYLVLCQPAAGALEGVRVEVSRGDFRAEVDVCCEWRHGSGHRPQDLVIRAKSTAASVSLTTVERANKRLIRRAQRIGLAIGSLMALGAFWSFAGTPNPVIAGMMLTVISATLIAAGWLLAGRIGEGIADRRRHRMREETDRDSALQEGFRRWHSLRREIRGRRRELERGSIGAPFRRSA